MAYKLVLYTHNYSTMHLIYIRTPHLRVCTCNYCVVVLAGVTSSLHGAVMAQYSVQLNKLLMFNSSWIRYHDMDGVPDFLVLKSVYDASLTTKWKPGDRFAALIDGFYSFGTVLGSTSKKK